METFLKRSLSMLLALLLVLSLVPVSSLAAEDDVATQYDLQALHSMIREAAKNVNVEQETAEEENEKEAPAKRAPVTRSESYTNTPDDGHEHVAVQSEEVQALCQDPGMTAGTYCSLCGLTLSGRVEIPARGHMIFSYDAKVATFTSVGWNAYEECGRCAYTTYVEIPKLEVPSISDYETFLMYLSLLEESASLYVLENPGKDPLDLMIKYIRTGVERYTTGSWGIMAGYEDADFAQYVATLEDMVNTEIGVPEEMIAISSLKNLELITLPNGQVTDLGHMFGTMDITYHNNCGVNHADVGGWAGDLVDLLEYADYSGVTGTVEGMATTIRNDYLLVAHDLSVGSFSQTDFYGDIDAMMVLNAIVEQGYEYDYDNYVGSLLLTIMEHFTEDLSDEDRAAYLLANRLGGVSNRLDVREAVYNAYISNKVITTLEGTREFTSKDLASLRKATCYAFADYICQLAGDYVEDMGNSLFTVFSTTSATLAPGITQQTKMATTADGKQIVYYLATGDLTRGDVSLYANYHNNDPSQGWEMQRVMDQANAAQERHSDPTTEHYIENYNVVASVNGAGFNMGTGEPSGVLVMGGKEYQSISSAGFVGILKDGTPVIGTQEEYNTIYKGQVQEAIACFGSRLIKDGKIVEGLTDELASRTAIGFTKTGKVVLLVLDGRQEPFSAGGGYATLAQILYEAGCVEATNLDGGGSSTFVAKMPGEEELAVINRPSDGFARSVSTSWMLVSTAPSSTTFDHAILECDNNYMTAGVSVQVTATGISPSGNAVNLPEGTAWAVSDESVGTITEDGVFTALNNGTVDVYLMLEGEVVGTKTMYVVVPNNLYFTKTNLDTVYGSSVELPVKLVYNNKDILFTPADVTFSLSNAKAGAVDGLAFFANSDENCGIKNVTVSASLAADSSYTAIILVAIYKQGETTFDFEQATDGDRMFAWQRVVSNAEIDGDNVYTVIDASENMTTSYILAIDMTQIPIPERLSELTYMLPGSDIEGASAWTFLCQLAERISDMTQIKATIHYDPEMELDISELKLINDYFTLTGIEHDAENSKLTLTLNWINQSQAITVDTANPLCIVNGLKLTPKTDAAWNSASALSIENAGDISYTIYMRASALYSFAQKPENQETFGLYEYINPANSYDKGGYFKDTYATFDDKYTLINELRQGWYNENGGFAYYVDGIKVTGVYQVEGYYYDFGTDGINKGKTTYTGMVQSGGKYYYASLGTLKSGWQTIGEDYFYFDPATYAMHTGVSTINGMKYTFSDEGLLVRGAFAKVAGGTRYYWAGRYLVSRWIELPEGTYRADQNGYIAYGNYPVILAGREECTWWHFDEETGIRTGICDGFIQRAGETYYCENGAVLYGAVETQNGIIFCATLGKVPVNGSCYISDGLDHTAGLETGYYWVGADGYIQKDGFATINGATYYFNNYVRAKGITKIGEKYYFFNMGNGKMFRDASLWVSGSNPYGITGGYYYFQADGSMYIPDPNGPKAVVEKNGKLYFTIDGVNQTNGLNELDGEYYYAYTDGTLAVNKVVYISSFNDLIAPGTGYFAFDGEGKLIKTGFVTSGSSVYYYNNLVRAKGFTKIGEKYYFFNAGSGILFKDTTLWVGNNSYGITGGYYYFQADGSMYIPDPNGPKAVVEKNGKLYFTIDGVNQTNGLNELDGEYYYAYTNGTLAVNTVVYISNFNGLIAPGAGYFAFDGEGKLVKTGFVTGGGATYYYNDLVRAKGFTKIGDAYYMFNAGSGKMLRDIVQWVGSNSYGVVGGYYYFQADGTMYIPDPNGPKAIVEKNGKLYFTIDGVNQTNGLNELDGEYYYAYTNGVLAVNTVAYISNFNDLIAPGAGHFAFDGEGKLVKTGFVTAPNGQTFYYSDLVRAKGFTKVGEKYYFFNTGSGAMFQDSTLWIGDNSYGIAGGYYYFQADGSMYIPDPNGPKAVVEKNGKLYFTIDGVNQTNGLNELDGEHYYAYTNGVLAVNTVVHISNFNGLIAPGAGYFAFDGEGKLVKTGFVTGGDATYYYNNLVRTKGFTKIGEKYYFFNAGSGKMLHDITQWVGENSYGVVGGYYYFQADGSMYIPDPNGPKAVVEKNGKLYFTIDGVNQTNGLNELDGEYYYAYTNGTLAVNTVVYISNFNGLIAPGAGYFAFDGEGKLVKTGFVTGGDATYYYNDLVRAKGFTKIGDDYYMFNAGSGKMACDMTQWVGENSYGVVGGFYYFQADGKMTVA